MGKKQSPNGHHTGSVLWADLEEHPVPKAPSAYGLDQVFQVFGHTRLDGTKEDMTEHENFAMIDSQKCFMIDEDIEPKIITLRDYEKLNNPKE